MISKIKILFFIAFLVPIMTIDSAAQAETVCQVTDPTGTPLNVREAPNGRIINKLKNGRRVYIHQVAYDNGNRPWAKIGGYYKGEYRIWGWVFREFISCYKR